MKHIMLVNAVHKEQMRMATVDEKGKLIEFNIQMAVREPITGNIYKGKVLKVERGLQAAFVDYGGVKDGFLPLRDVSPIYLKEQENGSGSGRPVLKSGQEIIVQVVREVIGNKGALLTSYTSLPGRYLVLLPNKLCGGISRKIESEEDRKKIKSLMEQIKVPEDMGFIVRTAGINRTKQEIQRDYQFLMRLWKDIKKKADSVSAPYFLYQETDFGVRSLRDYLTQEIEEILVDDVETFRKMRAYLKAVAPRHLRILKQYKEKVPIFDRFELEEQIREIYQERVELKSGGYIIINPTEAMITIDVNSGRGSNKRNIEETAFKTNLDACEEIARQLRLRDLGGLIVIDFIDMIDKKHVAEVEKAFKKALSMDRSRIQLSRISKFGLLELSRQKKQSTIQEISYITCPYCKGSGLRPSLEYASLGAFRTIESEAVKGIYSELKVSLPHEIAQYILNNKRAELFKLESSFGVALYIEGRSDMVWDKLEIQQSVKEQPVEVSAMQEVPLLQLAEETEPDAEPEVRPDAEIPVAGEPPRKKSRRRPRHRKKKNPMGSIEISMPPDDLLGETLSFTQPPPLSRVQTPLIPVKPMKIMKALPDEFYPVEPGGDLFAPEPEPEETGDDPDNL
ncbi:MAG: Rne/Rng family ribonuclease [Smithellaceae bacterium]|nr:Rne/Rng family ribonuclease [Syntrophaceae bacterium]MDD4241731.1 Rne/Rng family ribonuclease [Smithellaceae bacterium]NLX52536.1 Rne/Rng family ribonuclease [Deltaproteobacteria bacterium]